MQSKVSAQHQQRDTAKATIPAAKFQFSTWTIFVLQVWVLDFGRPVFPLYFTADNPSSLTWSDCSHIAYNYITALCLIRLQDRASQPVSRLIHHLLLVSFVIGASIHMVADAVQQRLLRAGAMPHLTIHQQPMLQGVDESIVESFQFLDYLDEELGHQVWYTSLYLLFLLYFSSCFFTNNTLSVDRDHKKMSNRSSKKTMHHSTSNLTSNLSFCVLVILNGVHEWYAVTEAQVFPHFLAASLTMILILVWRYSQGKSLDLNGLFLLLRMLLTIILVMVWVAMLWKDDALRAKYSNHWFYVPEPWSYFSLHHNMQCITQQ